MNLENKFTKIDGKYYVVGPCIEAGECVGDYVEVRLSSGDTKQVLISNIEENRSKKPFFGGNQKLGVPATKREEAEYCGYNEDDNIHDNWEAFRGCFY